MVISRHVLHSADLDCNEALDAGDPAADARERALSKAIETRSSYETCEMTGAIDLTMSLKCAHSVAAHISVWAWP